MESLNKRWLKYFDEISKLRNDLDSTGRIRGGEREFVILKEDIVKKLELSKSDILLDIGCGGGTLDCEISPLVKNIVGIEASQGQIERAQKIVINYSNINIIKGNALNLPVKEKQFNKVLCYSVIHHLVDIEGMKSFLLEIAKSCKKGTLILIGDIPYEENPLGVIRGKFFTLLIKRKIVDFLETIHALFKKKIALKKASVDVKELFTFSPQELQEVADKIGMEAKILEQDKRLLFHKYRFDLLLSIRDGQKAG